MSFKHRLRNLSRQHFGLDIVRFPLHDPLARTVQLLQHHSVNCVVDVGANDGGFASSIRGLGYNGRIISFEPLTKPFTSLNMKAARDSSWEAFRYAVGDTTGEVVINVSGNSGLSSSVLPMLHAHTDVAPESRYVSTETVPQARLDTLLAGIEPCADVRVFLKVDVQGYEKAVLDGAAGLFAAGLIVGMQLEMSLTPLYEGGMTYREVLDHADGLGMEIMGLDPVFADPKSGRLLQADAVFFAC